MKESFREKAFGVEARERIRQCDDIISEYQDQGYRLTLRQLYYQLVSRDFIPNTEKSYKGLGGLVSDARLAGLLDWDGIEDRGRVPSAPHSWEGVDDLLRAFHNSVDGYNLPRWKDQPNYVELWVEKDALAGVLQPLAQKHHVTLMVNKGYSSQSAMYASAQRFIENQGGDEYDDGGPLRKGVLLYLGDHDPSGEDMVRDIQDRLTMFHAQVCVTKVALTMAQVKQHQPPPNPAKITDPRAKSYIEKHGNSSWEVDALPPNILGRIINAAITKLVEPEPLARVLAQEKKDKQVLTAALKSVRREDP